MDLRGPKGWLSTSVDDGPFHVVPGYRDSGDIGEGHVVSVDCPCGPTILPADPFDTSPDAYDPSIEPIYNHHDAAWPGSEDRLA